MIEYANGRKADQHVPDVCMCGHNVAAATTPGICPVMSCPCTDHVEAR